MISLYLLAAHLVGDFLLQNRWMARKKLRNASWRTYHVAVYCLPFIPIVAFYASSWPRGIAFFVGLFVMHWVTDSHQFRASLGDWLHWKLFARPATKNDEWLRTPPALRPASAWGNALPPNVWPLVGTAVDQTLHIVQLAILGGLFL